MKIYRFYLIALGVIIIDQTVKLLVYTHMDLNTEFSVIGEWFKIHYLLNPGMAFGLRSTHEYGKLLLTIFRLFAMFGIAYYMHYLYRKNVKPGLLVCMGLILGGAIGNVIDSTFYGVLLNNAPLGSPTPWFHGQVIDMLFFPMVEGYYPDWLPYVGGDQFLFFSPVFNIADSAIFVGVVSILIFQKRFFHNRSEHLITEEEMQEEENASVNNDEIIS